MKLIFVMCKVSAKARLSSTGSELWITLYVKTLLSLPTGTWYLVPGTLECNYVLTLQKLSPYIIARIICRGHSSGVYYPKNFQDNIYIRLYHGTVVNVVELNLVLSIC